VPGAQCQVITQRCNIGETVTFYVSLMSQSYYLLIYKPDGSAVALDIGSGPGSSYVSGEAGSPPGTRTVELWARGTTGPDYLAAQCGSFTVEGQGGCRNDLDCPQGYKCGFEGVCYLPAQRVCSEGEVKLLETCPDGYTWKHRQVCRNNALNDEYQQCPTQPQLPQVPQQPPIDLTPIAIAIVLAAVILGLVLLVSRRRR